MSNDTNSFPHKITEESPRCVILSGNEAWGWTTRSAACARRSVGCATSCGMGWPGSPRATGLPSEGYPPPPGASSMGTLSGGNTQIRISTDLELHPMLRGTNLPYLSPNTEPWFNAKPPLVRRVSVHRQFFGYWNSVTGQK